MKRKVIKRFMVAAFSVALIGLISCSDLKEDKIGNTDNGDVNINEDIEEETPLGINKEEDGKRLKELEDIINNQFMILVNKENKLSEDYVPENLVLSEIEFLDYIETRELNKVAADAVKEMFEAALNDGIHLLGASGYRSYGIQKNMYDSRVASMGEERTSLYTAIPGASEHQTGLAIDILGEDYQYLDDGFENSDSFKWLMDNCYKYGFILRYLKGKEDITGYNYEPWHFRYIGNNEVAKEIMEQNITFEEYLENVSLEIENLNVDAE